jgi:competence protein ComFC
VDNLDHSIGLSLYRALWLTADWLFPPFCPGCGRQGFRFCPECESNTQVLHSTLKTSARSDLFDFDPENLAKNGSCSHFSGIASFAEFSGPVRRAIHHLKYNQDAALAEFFSFHLFMMVKELKWDFDIVTTIPLGSSRQKERGFNQADLLAFPLALRFRKHFHPHLIKRIRDTESQVGKSAAERKTNVKGAFQADPIMSKGERVLLLDDVITTGATITACAKALQNAGVREIYGLSLAKTPLKHHADEKINEFAV